MKVSERELRERNLIYLLLHDKKCLHNFTLKKIKADQFIEENRLLVKAILETYQKYNVCFSRDYMKQYIKDNFKIPKDRISFELAFNSCYSASTKPDHFPLLIEQFKDDAIKDNFTQALSKITNSKDLTTFEIVQHLNSDCEKILSVYASNTEYSELYQEFLHYRQFPLDIFPEEIRTALSSYRKKWNCSIDYLANPYLFSVSTALNCKYKISINGKTTDGRMNGFAVGDSGQGKSEPAKDVFHIYDDLDKQAKEDYDNKLSIYEKKKIIYDAQLSKFKRSKNLDYADCPEKPIEPIQRQYIFEFATIESIHEVISHNPDGIMLQIEEFYPWFESLGNYSNGSAAATMAQLQKYYDSDFDRPVKHGRKSKTAQIYTPKHYAVFYAQAQPEILPITILQKRLIHTGFVNRFLYFYPDKSSYKEVSLNSYVVPQKHKDYLNNIITGIYAIQISSEWSDFQTVYLNSDSVSGETWQVYMDYFKWLDRTEHNDNDSLPVIIAMFIGRHKKHLSKLILNLHILNSYLLKSDNKIIQKKTVEDAILLSKYYISHFLKLYEIFLKHSKKTETGIKVQGDYDRILNSVMEGKKSVRDIQAKTKITANKIRPILKQLEKDGVGTCQVSEQGRNKGQVSEFVKS